MAEKLTGSDDKKKKKPSKKHNQADLTRALEPFLNKICKAYDEQEKDNGAHSLAIGKLYGDCAEKIGFPKGLIQSHVAKIRRGIKAEAAIKEMEREEIEDELELLSGYSEIPMFSKHMETRREQLNAQLKTMPVTTEA